MPISDKSRKILWVRSGNQCAFCQTRLVLDRTDKNEESIVGDEAHIVSKSPKGPRGYVQIACDHDAYENFILLCKIHHKLVDDQPETYTFDFLILLKSMHEAWVDQQLNRPIENPNDVHLKRIQSGKELGILFQGSLSFWHSEDDLESAEARELVAIFLESIEDYMDVWDECGIGEQMRIEGMFDKWIKEIEQFGYWIFGAVDPEPRDERGNKLPNWKGFIIALKKNTDPEILRD